MDLDLRKRGYCRDVFLSLSLSLNLHVVISEAFLRIVSFSPPRLKRIHYHTLYNNL